MSGGPGGSGASEISGPNAATDGQERQETRDRNERPQPTPRTFPAGSYIIRMDQPYSRIADSLLDYQYWSPNDPQRTPYDDTGWTFPELFNVQATRVTDVKVLDAPMQLVAGAVRAPGAVAGASTSLDASAASVYVVNHNADIALATLRVPDDAPRDHALDDG